jgi:AraC-like DNA-binding protein
MSLHLREGFAGQDMFVIPRPILADARRHPLVRSLYPTDIGWFPEARYHFRERVNGAPEDHLMMCIGGHGYVVVDGKKSHLQAGQLIIIPRHCPHTYWAAEDEPWSTFWMHFLGEDADYYVERIPHVAEPVAIDETTRQEAERLFRDCLDTLENGYALPTLIYAAQSAQHILSLLLFRNPALPMEQRAESRRLKCDAVIEYMHSCIAEPVTLEQLAREADLSVSHFSEMFREQTHHSPMSFYTHLRIRAACRLLDLTRKPVKVVAMETGYGDPYYFSRVFKKVMGISPEKYRSVKKG